MIQQTKPVYLLLFIVFLFASIASQAQIGMKMTAEHERFLRYEPIVLRLSLRNYSGNTLVFGENEHGQGKLVFTVVAQSGHIVSAIDPKANPMAGLVFAPGQSRELTITLNAIFDLQKNDFYNVTAYVDHNRLPQAFASNEVTFEVREGILLSTKTIGLPTTKNDELIKSIQASLMRFNDGVGEIYCLRVEDDDKVYGTFRIGPYISGSRPQLDADGSSAIHVLVQVRPKLYSYAVYSVIGGEAKMRQQRYYVPENGVPTISRAPGYLKILYAKQAVEGVDFKFQEENWKPKTK